MKKHKMAKKDLRMVKNRNFENKRVSITPKIKTPRPKTVTCASRCVTNTHKDSKDRGSYTIFIASFLQSYQVAVR